MAGGVLVLILRIILIVTYFPKFATKVKFWDYCHIMGDKLIFICNKMVLDF